MTRLRNTIAVALGAVLFSATVPLSAQSIIDDAQRNIEEARRSQEEVKRQAAEAAAELDVLNAEDAEVVAALAEVDEYIAIQEAKLAAAQLAHDTAVADATRFDAKAAELDATIIQLRSEMSQRAVEAYVQQSDRDSYLLETGDPNLAAQRTFLVSEINGSTADVADQLRAAVDDAAAARAAAEAARAKAEQERVDIGVRLAELEDARAAQAEIKAEVDRRIGDLDERAAVLEAESARIEQFIAGEQGRIASEVQRQQAQLLAEQQRLEQERLRLERERQEAAQRQREEENGELPPAEQPASQPSGPSEPPPLAPGPPAPGNISFIWPLSGPVTSGYGYRVHPIFGETRLHTGIDIDGAMGQPIVAAAGGTVISVGGRDGYGNTVIIDHGSGWSTLYAHMSGFNVVGGESIGQGSTIGFVGSTGYSTGPHLHFEVRVNGAHTDPYAYL